MDISHVTNIDISSEMKKSFLSYAMSVIVSRALPDIRDGLKPVQRRIIFGMTKLLLYNNSSYKKSARIVGDVMGKYHPHGDTSIYEAMVNMAQFFSYRYPLVDGHGNFGSIDGDEPASMRYTEARMAKITMEFIKDIEKEIVNWRDNYDSSEQEPQILPVRYPNLLANGATGIAVGMATNIPPHNLTEVIDAIIFNIQKEKQATLKELLTFVKGPDFPTGGLILDAYLLEKAYETGNGKITLRSKIKQIVQEKKQLLIITEIPYQINKSKLISQIAELAKNKTIPNITKLKDESNIKEGIRVVIEVKKNANLEVVLNNLYKQTSLQISYNFNMIALIDQKPVKVNLKQMIDFYIDFQIDLIQKKTEYNLKKALQRIHLLKALILVLNDIDKVIELIKKSQDTKEAIFNLQKTYKFDDLQAKYILDTKLQKLTNFEITKIEEETETLTKQIIQYQKIIDSHEEKNIILINDLLEIKNKFGDQRRTMISTKRNLNIEDADLIPQRDILITLTKNNYVKRMLIEDYKLQNRGGRGSSQIKIYQDDLVIKIKETSTHDFQLFFSDKGKVYKIKGFQIPEGSSNSKGKPLNHLFPLEENENILSFASVSDFQQNLFLIFVTKKGLVKKSSLNIYQNIQKNGIKAIFLKENDELIDVLISNGNQNLVLASSAGKAIRFDEKSINATGRNTSGVKGIKLLKNQTLIGSALLDNENEELLIITDKGFGKKTIASDYRTQTRGGQGTKTITLSDKKGIPLDFKKVTKNEDLIVISNKGIVIRIPVKQINSQGKTTQGAKIINLKDQQKVSSITLVSSVIEEN